VAQESVLATIAAAVARVSRHVMPSLIKVHIVNGKLMNRIHQKRSMANALGMIPDVVGATKLHAHVWLPKDLIVGGSLLMAQREVA